MAFKYEKLWELISIRGISRDQLRRKIGSSQTTIVSLGQNKNVSLDIIDRICQVLKCTPFEIMEYVPDPNSKLERITISRGEIYMVNFLGEKVCPAVVIQGEEWIDNGFSLMVVPILSELPSEHSSYIRIGPSPQNGYESFRYVLLSKMGHVQRFQLTNKIGEIINDDMQFVDECIENYLGLVKKPTN